MLTYSGAYRRPCVSESAHEELIVYLAKITPHPSSGNRSANEVYKRLVKNVRQLLTLPLKQVIIMNRRLVIHGSMEAIMFPCMWQAPSPSFPIQDFEGKLLCITDVMACSVVISKNEYKNLLLYCHCYS